MSGRAEDGNHREEPKDAEVYVIIQNLLQKQAADAQDVRES